VELSIHYIVPKYNSSTNGVAAMNGVLYNSDRSACKLPKYGCIVFYEDQDIHDGIGNRKPGFPHILAVQAIGRNSPLVEICI